MAKKTFEQSMHELEQIVAELESGTLPLDQALKKFESGIKLSKACSRMLDDTEKRIALLLQDRDGNPVSQSFLPEDETDDQS